MIETSDIQTKINSDFGENASEAVELLEEAILKADHLNNDRIIRCILFLSEKNIEKLKETIQAATLDPRDVMLWAEYSGQGVSIRQVRDFRKSFEEAEG